MKRIRMGVLGAADIAERRFLPALQKTEEFIFAGVAASSPERAARAERFVSIYGGKVYPGYEELLTDERIDAVYIPQPPALHYKWAKKALSCGKHVLLEKPGTTRLEDTEELLFLAQKAGIALAENYAFCFHRQIAVIQDIIRSGELGELRLVRSAFGFPYRSGADFRYKSSLGGGALLDCGGYTLKVAQLFLGNEAGITASKLNHTGIHDVDMFGSATLQNGEGLTAQVSFGMDNYYKCELELWGSRGYLTAPRIFTPPAEMETTVIVRNQDGEKQIRVEPDDQFQHMLEDFAECIHNPEKAKETELAMRCQMKLVQEIQRRERM